jgi:hypothetical protein
MDEEEREERYQKAVANVFAGLMGMIKKEVNTDG